MKVGDFFDPAIYHLAAKAETDYGEVIVVDDNVPKMSSESSHYYVGTVADESMTDGETTGNARLEAIFEYGLGGDCGDWGEKLSSDLAYLQALTKMVELVTSWSGV